MNQRHGRHVFWEGWEEADSGDRVQATKYAEEIIFADKSAVRWTSFGWEPVDQQSGGTSETEADLFINHQMDAAVPVLAHAEATRRSPFEIAPIDPGAQPAN